MNVELIPADTTLEALRVQVAALQRLSPDRRLALACRMNDSLRAIVRAGVRSRHPEYTEQQVKLAAIRLTLGDELFRTVYNGLEIAV